jgi:uncharacterized protein (DUF1778 family)
MGVKKLNAFTKRGLIQARVNNDDMREIVTKAQMYTKGNVSDFVRLAALNYRPLKKVLK